MHSLKLVLLTFLFISPAFVNAQTSVSKNFESLASVESNLLELDTDDWTIFTGEEANTFYFDFNNISSNLKEIQVVSENGEVIFKDELWNLPVDTIYELDMQTYKKGNYQVFIKTFSEEIKKSVNVI